MPDIRLTETFKEFFKNEKSSGFVLIVCSIISLIVANSMFSDSYLGFWKSYVGGLTISYWVNDGLMAIFFLLIGLELKRELYKGELSDLKSAMLPIFAALGGIALPALFHFGFNKGLPTQAGFGIPMATDIALCNTGIVIGADWAASLATPNSLGVSSGLLIGKVVGVILARIEICDLALPETAEFQL